MSEFDEEAEREKLREQLERDQADREATQRMSELLLGGATMTGRHCQNCASPIFRQNGREFCPNCNRATGESAQAQAGQQAPDDGADQPRTDEADGTVDATGGSRPQVEPVESAPESDATRASTSGSDANRGSVSSAGASERVAATCGDLGDARDALARKLTRLASQAEATDDVGRARELLAATREAAEALAALDRVGDDR